MYQSVEISDNKVKDGSLGIRHNELPEKVRRIFEAGTKENIERMVKDGELVQVNL